MYIRASLYFLATVFWGCADDLDNHTHKDLTDDQSLESNDSVRVTPQAKEDVDELIVKKAPQVAEQILEALHAAIPKTSPDSETFDSSNVWVSSNNSESEVVEKDELATVPTPVVEELVEFEESTSSSPAPVQKSFKLPVPSAPLESSARKSGRSFRLHRGMPVLNLWYSRKD